MHLRLIRLILRLYESSLTAQLGDPLPRKGSHVIGWAWSHKRLWFSHQSNPLWDPALPTHQEVYKYSYLYALAPETSTAKPTDHGHTDIVEAWPCPMTSLESLPRMETWSGVSRSAPTPRLGLTDGHNSVIRCAGMCLKTNPAWIPTSGSMLSSPASCVNTARSATNAIWCCLAGWWPGCC